MPREFVPDRGSNIIVACVLFMFVLGMVIGFFAGKNYYADKYGLKTEQK